MVQNQQQEMLFKIVQFIDVLKQQKLSPTILQFKRALFEKIRQELRQQQSKLKQYYHNYNQEDQTELIQKNFKMILYKCQTQKINYLLKDYLRIRLVKIQKYCFYLMQNKTLAEKLLSTNEYLFLNSYSQLKYKYFAGNVFSMLHKNYRGLGGIQTLFKESEKGSLLQSKQSKIDLVQPNLNKYCYVKIKINPNELRNNDFKINNIKDKTMEIVSPQDIIFGPYKNVKEMIQQGYAQLI